MIGKAIKMMWNYFEGSMLIIGVIITTWLKYFTDFLNEFPIEKTNHYVYFIYIGSLILLSIRQIFKNKGNKPDKKD